jgi:signal transduction histidine kinase
VLAGSVVAVGLSALDDAEEVTLAALIDRPVGAVALLAIATAALWWRRARPTAVTAVVLATMVVWAALGYGDGNDLALAVALYSIGRHATHHINSAGAVTVAVCISTLGTVVDPNQRVDLLPAIVLTVVPWYVGRQVRNRGDYLALLQDRARRLEAEQQARASRAVADERARIARELHDVVAHRVSMMTVQAGAAKTIARHDLDAAIEAMADTELAGRQALGELRHLLGVLRPDDADRPDDGGGQLGPQPGLDGLPDLADELRRTGATVTLSTMELDTEVGAAVHLSAYRIVQESLTNVVRHAGPEPRVDITAAIEDGRLIIEIVNTVARSSGLAGSLPASGYGLVGMQERAASLGGTLTAGTDPTGDYRVRAELPLNGRST